MATDNQGTPVYSDAADIHISFYSLFLLRPYCRRAPVRGFRLNFPLGAIAERIGKAETANGGAPQHPFK